MDIMSAIYGAFGGSVTVVTFFAGLYGYARMQGFKLLPEDLGETVEKLQADYAGLLEEVRGAIGNVSLVEVGAIVMRAQELGKDGYTKADAEELGIMAIDAMKD